MKNWGSDTHTLKTVFPDGRRTKREITVEKVVVKKKIAKWKRKMMTLWCA